MRYILWHYCQSETSLRRLQGTKEHAKSIKRTRDHVKTLEGTRKLRVFSGNIANFSFCVEICGDCKIHNLELHQCQNSVFQLRMQTVAANMQSRIHFRNSELQLTKRVNHAIRQFIKPNLQGRKAKPELGMLMHCGP